MALEDITSLGKFCRSFDSWRFELARKQINFPTQLVGPRVVLLHVMRLDLGLCLLVVHQSVCSRFCASIVFARSLTDSMDVFRHQPLANGSIRLLQLLPCQSPEDEHTVPSDSGICDQCARCIILHTPLEHSPPYTAVSYAWGHVDAKHPILVNGQRFDINENLEAALRHLTPPDEALMLWIDFICINQKDDVEKSSQVELMREIYSRATSVLTWLGPLADDSDVAMRWIRDFGACACELGIGTTPEKQLGRLLRAVDSDEAGSVPTELREFARDVRDQLSPKKPDNRHVVAALAKLFARPYWSRVWVVQEVANAKRLVFRCGKAVVSEDAMHHSLRLLRNSRKHLLSESMTKDSQLKDALLTIASVQTQAPVTLLKIRRARGPFRLIYLIRMTRNFLATDLRDKIFALFGLASDAGAMGLRPDYQMDETDVFVETSMALLRHGHLDILSLCSFQGETARLPSWVHDPTLGVSRVALQQRTLLRGDGTCQSVLQPDFSAGKVDDSSDGSRLDVSRTSISLDVMCVGQVTRVGSAWEAKAQGKWLQDLRHLSDPYGHWDQFAPREAVWYTSVAHQELRTGTNKPSLSRELVQKIDDNLGRVELDGLTSDVFASLGLWDYCSQIGSVARARRPLCIAGEYIGVGPEGAQPGDLVYVFRGFSVPFVLRRGSDDRLRLVGEAYVYGVMDGQVTKSGSGFTKITIY